MLLIGRWDRWLRVRRRRLFLGCASPMTRRRRSPIWSSLMPVTNAALTTGWVNFPTLDFASPTMQAGAGQLDGNAATNRQLIANIFLSGVFVGPRQEIFFRWSDV